MTLKLTGRPERELTNLAINLRRYGQHKFWRNWILKLDRTTLLRLLPPGTQGNDSELRLMLMRLVEKRMAHIIEGQERVRAMMDRDDPRVDARVKRDKEGRAWLSSDMHTRGERGRFKGGTKMTEDQRKWVKEASFRANKERSDKEIKEWDQEFRQRQRRMER